MSQQQRAAVASGGEGMQSVTQVSVLGQLPCALLEQALRRLRAHAEHEETFTSSEDVLSRGAQGPGQPAREEDILRVRQIHFDARGTEWYINALGRPSPARENGEVLIRSITSTPVLEGDARSLAVALGYAERKFSPGRRGHLFSLAGGLTTVQVYRLFAPPEASEPLDATSYLVEVVSQTAHRPAPALPGAPPMQALRETAIERVLALRRVLKGLVDLARVE